MDEYCYHFLCQQTIIGKDTAMYERFHIFVVWSFLNTKKFNDSGTKDQWARDDPAFLVLLLTILAISSILFAWTIQLSFIGFIAFFLWVVFIDCIGVGILIATILW